VIRVGRALTSGYRHHRDGSMSKRGLTKSVSEAAAISVGCPIRVRECQLGSCLPFQVTPGGDGLFVRRQSVLASCLDVCLASRMLHWCYGGSLIGT
jgi:hypothetical protein